MLDAINDFVTGLAGHPWVYVALLCLCVIDAFFPPLPSESVVVALAALSASGPPNVWLVALVAAVGACIGDNIAYQLGKTVGLERFRWQRRPKVRKTLQWAGDQLALRGAVLIITGRYVPVGRIAVNMTAGATHYRRRRFIIFDAVAAVSWAGWSAGIGRLAGSWAEDNPILGAGIAIVVAIIIGVAVDHLIRHFSRSDRGGAAEPAGGGQQELADGQPAAGTASAGPHDRLAEQGDAGGA